ncbi:MAG: MMPL family transporter [Candidatus Dormibacteraceae bacterium]
MRLPGSLPAISMGGEARQRMDPFAWLTDLVIRRRWLVIGVWIVVITGCAAFLAPHAAEALQGGSLLLPGSESDRAGVLLQDRLGASSQSTVVAVLRSPELTVDDPGFKAEVDAAADRLAMVRGVRSVQTLYSTGEPALAAPGRHTTVVRIALAGDEQAQQAAVPRLRAALRPTRLEHSVTGFAAVNYDSLGASEADAHVAELIFLPVLFVLLLLAFRTLPAALIPLTLGGLTVAVTQGLLLPLGRLVPTSVFALNIGSMIGLGLCIDYSLIIVNRYREEIQDGQSGHDALLICMATAGRSITYSGATVIVAMIAMTILLIPIVMVRSISLAVALVAAVAILFALTLLPAILQLLGHRIESFAVLPPARRSKPGEVGFWYRFSNQIMAHPAAWLIGGLTLLMLLATPFRSIVLGGPGIPAGVESARGADAMTAAFGPGRLTPVQIVIHTRSAGGVWTPEVLGAIDDLTRRLGGDGRVESVQSLRTALADLPRDRFTQLTPALAGSGLDRLGSLVDTRGGDTTTVSVYSRTGQFDARTAALLADIRGRVLPATAGLATADVSVGGETAVFQDFEAGLYDRFPLVAGVVMLLIFLILMMFFQSVLLPLKAVVLNLISIGATFGVLVALFQYGWGARLFGFTPLGRITMITPAILFVILFALSTDYEVFMLSRVREYYRQTGNNTEAVAAGLQHTAGVITAAAVILLGTFGSFAFGKTVVIKELGIGLAAGVFIDSTLVRLILVPASMRLLGTGNWWLPAWLKRVLPELHEEAGQAIAHGVIEVVEPVPGTGGPVFPGSGVGLTPQALPPAPPAPTAAAEPPAISAQPARLLVQGNWDGPPEIRLRPDAPLRIGRDVTNELRLVDLHVSRLHARIDYVGDRYVLTDLSFNGVLINGHRAPALPARTVLHNGDRIHIRGYRPLSFVFATDTIA